MGISSRDTVNNSINRKKTPALIDNLAEVTDVIYTLDHPARQDNEDSIPIGTIECRLINDTNYNSFLAFPMNPYIKQYPLKGEIVFITTGFRKRENWTAGRQEIFYSTILNVYDYLNSNEMPNSSMPSYLTDEYRGLGDYFADIQNIKIKELLPFEGDIVYQGRWGQSIRFGYTTPTNIGNDWSTRGDQGSPLIIIRNGKIEEANPPNYFVENINDDAASIYICDGQLIPLNLATGNDVYAYNTAPVLPTSWDGKQIIINSDRLVLNAQNDDILISAKNILGVQSDNNITIQAKTDVIIHSKQRSDGIIIGKNANDHAVLGETLKDILDKFMQDYLIHTHPTGTGPSGPPLPPTMTAISRLKTNLRSILSRIVKIK